MTFLLLGRTSPDRGRGPELGWEKCYVLGKESAHVSQARTAPAETPAITPERQPLATLLAQPPGQALPVGQRPPCPRPTPLPPACPVGTHPQHRTDRLPGFVEDGPSLADRGPFTAGAQGVRY
ncbi:hypothetical protein SSOG_02863 [Streptomyces himastatinicus ATCC 53653]|uniref:Uncharacterized protein n=1 Tax=Streptomyces himastatinicus ATCC 53653 TaxID=457427 RepID=D9WEB0_9ACTN|nr:hypothetical protein SSOG_02863 [Streptomyces himastatinicus ATCC 53653]